MFSGKLNMFDHILLQNIFSFEHDVGYQDEAHRSTNFHFWRWRSIFCQCETSLIVYVVHPSTKLVKLNQTELWEHGTHCEIEATLCCSSASVLTIVRNHLAMKKFTGSRWWKCERNKRDNKMGYPPYCPDLALKDSFLFPNVGNKLDE